MISYLADTELRLLQLPVEVRSTQRIATVPECTRISRDYGNPTIYYIDAKGCLLSPAGGRVQIHESISTRSDWTELATIDNDVVVLSRDGDLYIAGTGELVHTRVKRLQGQLYCQLIIQFRTRVRRIASQDDIRHTHGVVDIPADADYISLGEEPMSYVNKGRAYLSWGDPSDSFSRTDVCKYPFQYSTWWCYTVEVPGSHRYIRCEQEYDYDTYFYRADGGVTIIPANWLDRASKASKPQPRALSPHIPFIDLKFSFPIIDVRRTTDPCGILSIEEYLVLLSNGWLYKTTQDSKDLIAKEVVSISVVESTTGDSWTVTLLSQNDTLTTIESI
jgi:hypothetical protein